MLLDARGGGTGQGPSSGGRTLFLKTQVTPLRRIGSRMGARTADTVAGRAKVGVSADSVEAAMVSVGSAGDEAGREANRPSAVAPFQHYLGPDGHHIGISKLGKLSFDRPHLGGAGAGPNWHKNRASERSVDGGYSRQGIGMSSTIAPGRHPARGGSSNRSGHRGRI